MSFGLLVGVSVLAGFVGAMSGMGGGVILIPALTLLGFDIKHAIGISIISVIATSSGSASAYVRDHITNLKLGMFLEMFTIVGALAGAAITLVSSEAPLFIIFGLVLLISWVVLFLQRREHWKPAPRQDAFSRWLELKGSYYDQASHEQIEYHAVRAHFGGLLMFGAGLISGLLGIGARGRRLDGVSIVKQHTEKPNPVSIWPSVYGIWVRYMRTESYSRWIWRSRRKIAEPLEVS